MKSIYGNNFYISIAYTSESPTQAAKTAQLFGCSREQVRSIRNASALLRDEGEERFIEAFAPFEVVDCSSKPCKTMTVKLQVNKSYESRPLNSVEFNQCAEVIKKELSKLGIEANIDLKPHHPHAKSKLL